MLHHTKDLKHKPEYNKVQKEKYSLSQKTIVNNKGFVELNKENSC